MPTRATVEADLHNKVDSYMKTVTALRAVANELMFDDRVRTAKAGAVAHSGRKMMTSIGNRHSPRIYITPDLLVDIPQPTNEKTLIECKWGFHRDGRFEHEIDELKK